MKTKPITPMHPTRRQPAAGATVDRAARIQQHLPLVHSMARRMAHLAQASSILDYEDLVGYGSEGLIHAVDSFDPTRTVPFATWAMLHIRTTIQDALRALDPLPRGLRATGQAIERASQDLAHRTGSWPQDAAVAAELGIPLAKVRTTMRHVRTVCVSLDSVEDAHGDDRGSSWLSSLADDDPESDPQRVLDRNATPALLADALAQLPERERRLVWEHDWRGRTLREIGAAWGLSESRISQLRTRALTRMRASLTETLADTRCVRGAA